MDMKVGLFEWKIYPCPDNNQEGKEFFFFEDKTLTPRVNHFPNNPIDS